MVYLLKCVLKCVRTEIICYMDVDLIGMVASSSKDSHGKGSTDWRSNNCFLPLSHAQPKCKCHRPGIIETWNYDSIDQAGRRYFKCANLDPDFMVW
jgi:hypothetical protein